MRGVILAGGTGSRLMPLTMVTNKHLLPVGRMPMIFHPILKLREGGLTDILIVTGREHMGDIVALLGSGMELGVSLTFRVQDEAGGIAQALGLAEGFAAADSVCVILGDNIFEDSIASDVVEFQNGSAKARILLKSVENPSRFGVATLDEAGRRIVEIIEKPGQPDSDLAVTGIYFYNSDVFDVVRTLTPSARGELEITDINNAYVQKGEMSFRILDGWWTDAGTFESLKQANLLTEETPAPRK